MKLIRIQVRATFDSGRVVVVDIDQDQLSLGAERVIADMLTGEIVAAIMERLEEEDDAEADDEIPTE